MRRFVGIAAVLIVVLGAAFFFFSRSGNLPGGVIKDSGDNISDYSAVFLTNGQVYFGKLTELNSDEVVIVDIFYLQVNQQEGLQPSNASTNNAASPEISLVKLGNELHGPNDRMRINRSQVLFTESLKDDSKVVKAVEDFKAK